MLEGRLLIYAFGGCVVTLLILKFVLTPSSNDCAVIITGESVKILNCEFTPEFLEYAKGLKAFNHWIENS